MSQLTARLSRRELIARSALSVVGTTLLAACAGPAAAPPAATTAPAPAAPTTAPAPAKPTIAPAAPTATSVTAAASTPATNAPAVKKSGNITILVRYDPQRKDLMTSDVEEILALFDEYQKSVQPGVKITLETLAVPTGAFDMDIIRQRALAGNIPDLVAFQPVATTMNSDLFYQFPRDLFDKPNPYSSNKRWWDDFPFDGAIFASYPGSTPGKYWAVGLSTLGGSSVVGIAYNRDMFEKAGIGPVPPKTHAEWMDWEGKLKGVGVVPFDAGNHLAADCCAVWFHGEMYDNLIEAHHAELEQQAADFFGEKTDGMLNPRWGAYLLKTNRWDFGNEYQTAFFRILKDRSAGFQPGFLGQTTKNLFLSGEAAQCFVDQSQIRAWRLQIGNQFKWGTFYAPPITKETWEKAPGLPQRAHAASGLPAGFAFGGFFMIPQKTVKDGRLDLSLDLLYWLTAPDQLAKFGKQREPASAQPGVSVKDVYPNDPDMQEYWRFHYEPPAIQNGKRYGADEWWHLVGPGAEVDITKTLEAFLAGQIKTPEDAAAKMQQIATQAVDRYIAENSDLSPPPSQWK